MASLLIDSPTVLRQFLAAQTPLTSLIGSRLWGERNVPIEGYTPSDGPCLVFRTRGGLGLDYSSTILRESWVFKAYGEDEDEARLVYRTLFSVLHDAKGAGLYLAQVEVPGQSLEEPVLKWPYSLSYWTTLMMANFEPVI